MPQNAETNWGSWEVILAGGSQSGAIIWHLMWVCHEIIYSNYWAIKQKVPMKEILHPVYRKLITEVKIVLPCQCCSSNEEIADSTCCHSISYETIQYHLVIKSYSLSSLNGRDHRNMIRRQKWSLDETWCSGFTEWPETEVVAGKNITEETSASRQH